MENKTLSEKLGIRLLHLSHTECKRCYEEIEGIEKDVKKFIKEILELLDYDVDEREKYLYEKIKQKAGELADV